MLTLSTDHAPPHVIDLRLEVRDFLNERLAAGRFTARTDSWMSGVDLQFSGELAARGWVGMATPVAYGGRGRSALERYVVTEELLAAGAPVAAHWIADRQMAPSLLRNGTEAQKQRYLPGICAAERFFSIGMSEPDSGSDLASVRTQAVAVPGGWQLTGTKVWTSGAHYATNLVVLARTDKGASRHDGFSQFIVDLPNPDIHISPIRTINGEHHFNEVVFDGAVLPADSLLGTRGDGWRQVTSELANERSGPERILSTMPLLREWAGRAQALGSPTADRDLGQLIARAAVLRQLSLAVADRLGQGLDPAVEAALVKDLGTTFESDVIDVVRRHHLSEPGPTEDPLDELLRAAILQSPAFTLRGGPNEILRSIIAKGLES